MFNFRRFNSRPAYGNSAGERHRRRYYGVPASAGPVEDAA